MKNTLRALRFFPVILALLCSAGHFGVLAADSDMCFMVEGVAYDDEWIELLRVEIVSDAKQLDQPGGEAYALFGEDIYENVLVSTSFNVSFQGPADIGGVLSEVRFVLYLPYDPEVEIFWLYNREGDTLSHIVLGSALSEVAWFDVWETEDGYELDWDVAYSDDEGALPVDYDVLAVSVGTGEKNVLAWRAEENYLFVPYEWLDPEDTFFFRLLCHDAVTTLSADSQEFTAPEGVSKRIDEREPWPEDSGDWNSQDSETRRSDREGPNYIVIVIIAAVVVGAVFGALLLRKRARR